jgi:hypothetical protein
MSSLANTLPSFAPLAGSTLSFAAATVVPSPVQSTAGLDTYLVSNSGAAVVQLGIGTTSGAASTNAASVATCIPLLPGTTQVLTLGRNLWFTGYSASTGTVYVTAGAGI